jgi:hypothetical protein
LGNRILVIASDLEAAGTVEDVLRQFALNGDTVHVAVERGLSGTRDKIAGVARTSRVSFGPAVPASLRPWGSLAVLVRSCLDLLRAFEEPGREGEWQRRLLAQKAPSLARRLAASSLAGRRGLRESLVRRLVRIERALPVEPAILEFVRAHEPAMMMLLPLAGAGWSQADFIRAARALGIGTLGCSTGWWDLSVRGRVRELPDCIGVWNRDQRREAVELQGIPPQRTTIVGACGVDRFVDRSSGRSRAEMVRDVGLDPTRPVVLFAGGAETDAAVEIAVFRDWLRFRAENGSLVSEATVLVRSHPAHEREWRAAAASLAPAIVIDAGPKRDALVPWLHATDVLVALDTTLLPMSAACGVPVLGLFDDRLRAGQGDLARFQRRTSAPEWPVFAGAFDEHFRQVAESLRDGPDRASPARAAALAWARPHGPLLSPGFVIASRVVEEVAAYAQAAPAASNAAAVPGAGLRALSLAVSACGVDRKPALGDNQDAWAGGASSRGLNVQALLRGWAKGTARLPQRAAKRVRKRWSRIKKVPRRVASILRPGRYRAGIVRRSRAAVAFGHRLTNAAKKVPKRLVRSVRHARYHIGTLRSSLWK